MGVDIEMNQILKKMKRLMICTVLCFFSACSDKGKSDKKKEEVVQKQTEFQKTDETKKDGEARCQIQVERTCFIPGDNECLAYEMKEHKVCEEGK